MAVRIRLAAIVLIAGLLAACTSGDADPTPSPSTPVSQSTTTSPTPARTGPLTTGPNVRPGEKPPAFPDLARQHTDTGAVAFAGYYFKAFDWSYATNDAYLLRNLSLSSCGGCRASIRTIDGLAARNVTLVGGRVSLLSARIDSRDVGAQAQVVVDIELDEQPVVIEPPSAAPSTAAAAIRNHHSLVFLRWARSGWMVADVTAR